MKIFLKNKLILLVLIALPLNFASANQLKPLTLEAEDGARITGFVFEEKDTPASAPIALMFHGMTRSSLDWLADGFPTYGGKVSEILLAKGYRLVAVDARAHGVRKESLSPYKRVKALHSGNTAPYIEMIEKSVDDYRLVLAHIKEKYPEATQILAIGYSMGSQMAIMTTAKNPAITHLITMVPPHVGEAESVAPRTFSANVNTPWLLLTASKDQFSTQEQYAALAAAGTGPTEHQIFEGGHALPETYLATIEEWLKTIDK